LRHSESRGDPSKGRPVGRQVEVCQSVPKIDSRASHCGGAGRPHAVPHPRASGTLPKRQSGPSLCAPPARRCMRTIAWSTPMNIS